MSAVFLVIGSILIAVGAVLHIGFFYLESIAWSKPATWKQFGVKSPEDAELIRLWAYNQGAYNLFLGVGAIVGLLLIAVTELDQAGMGIVIFAGLFMAKAGGALLISNRRMARAALIQGGAPLIGVIALVASLF